MIARILKEEGNFFSWIGQPYFKLTNNPNFTDDSQAWDWVLKVAKICNECCHIRIEQSTKGTIVKYMRLDGNVQDTPYWFNEHLRRDRDVTY